MQAPSVEWMTTEQDQRIADAVLRHWRRLAAFIRSRVPEQGEAEDVLQDVFHALVEAQRLTTPIEQVEAWLFRVARNRIIDLFRKQRPEQMPGLPPAADGAEPLSLEDVLPSREAGPDALYARRVLLAELDAALDELPDEQRDVFVAHELEGRSFRQLAAETGLSINTLLSRKRYAVLHLRRRLQAIHDELTR
jgi:RNA polymerase sigma factor (sigma-70 family)